MPGRSTADNIVLVQEVIHAMRRKKGSVGSMLFKIDLEKAYDKVRWSFIEDTLAAFRVPRMLSDLIMSCLRSSSMSLIWNGSVCNSFSPSRGVRQGCPLSPYIFVMCMERLAALIEARVGSREWKPIRVPRGGIGLIHIFYADDLILMCEASLEQAQVVMDCLTVFSTA